MATKWECQKEAECNKGGSVKRTWLARAREGSEGQHRPVCSHLTLSSSTQQGRSLVARDRHLQGLPSLFYLMLSSLSSLPCPLQGKAPCHFSTPEVILFLPRSLPCVECKASVSCTGYKVPAFPCAQCPRAGERLHM